nr:hypothetical protein A6C57_23585 [Fibrella sp. ES10-3-2-2]
MPSGEKKEQEVEKRAGRPAGKGDTPEAQRIQAGRRKRLAEVIDQHFDGNKSAFASAVGMQPTGVSHLLKSRTITEQVCLQIAQGVGISAAWMLAGDGVMSDPPPPPAPDRVQSEGQRLQQYRMKRGISKRALGIMIGLSESSASISVGKYEESEQLEPKTKIALAKAFQIDEAEMRAILGGFQHLVQPAPTLDEQVAIEFIPVHARAGFAKALFFDEANLRYSEFEQISISRNALKAGYETERSRQGKVYIIEVNGDSMEPLLYSGYQVVIYVVDPNDWAYKTGVVAVLYRDEFVIKRIKDNRLDEDGRLTLHSDNPAGGSISVPRDEIRAIFQVDKIVDGRIK